MAELFYDRDADLGFLSKKTVAVIGYGSQGRAQARNLQDSGVKVLVGLYAGSPTRARVQADGLKVGTVAEVSAAADVVHLLVPDERMPAVYRQDVAPHLSAGKALGFSHGFNIHFDQIVPPSDVDVFMIAPKAPGNLVRRLYEEGQGTPALLAIHQDATGHARQLALAFAKGIGATRAGVLATTFGEETETDLFGEQTVLCGGVTELIKGGFETLVAAGYQPEVAYFETLHELKLIVDLIHEGGLAAMWDSVSDTAQFGGLTRGPEVVDASTRARMKDILERIQDGRFAREWILENQAGRPVFNKLTARDQAHPVEQVGAGLRAMMSWLQKNKESVR